MKQLTNDEILALSKEEQAHLLRGSLLLFTKVMFKARTGMDFRISQPIGREAHAKTISRAITRCVRCKSNRLIINIPPGYSKTLLLTHAVAWGLAINPQAKSIYTSYAQSLAKKPTSTIRQIIQMREFQELFDARISKSTYAKDDFETEQGGAVYGAGLGGTLTGLDAGIMSSQEYGGMFVVDDPIKPGDATSDAVKQTTWELITDTVMMRLRNPSVTPLILCGQRLFEDDPIGRILEQDKKGEWDRVILPNLDAAGNALDPYLYDVDKLLEMKEKQPFLFWSQHQQEPQPAGGSLFKPDWFVLMDEEPDIYSTFITADTAETDKSYNDATVFSFWGLYKIKHAGQDTGEIGLHWIDCVELRVEPKDLEHMFMDFYADCMRHKVKPGFAAIEKKSTGTYLLSLLDSLQGIRVVPIMRNRPEKEGGTLSKCSRFIQSQSYISRGLISLGRYARHTKMCLEHMSKITANDSHRFDDIADTCCDAINCAFIDRTAHIKYNSRHDALQRTLDAAAKLNQNQGNFFNPIGG